MRHAYEEIAEYLRREIRKKKKGEQLPCQAELMQKFGVSHMTVRRAWAELEKEGLLYRLQGKGVFVRGRKEGDRKVNFLLLTDPKWAHGDKSFWAPLITEIIYESTRRGISVYTTPFSSEVNEIPRYQFDGVITAASPDEEPEIVREIKEMGYPVVVLNRILPGENYLSTDHRKGSKQITEYLLKKGHHRIGFVGLYENHSFSVHRYEGYCNAMEKAGRKVIPALVVQEEIEKRNKKLFFARMVNEIEDYCERYQLTALISGGVQFAEVVVAGVRKMGKSIPEEIEVASWDEVPEEVEEKQVIHEIIQPLEEIGRKAVEETEKLILGRRKVVQIVLSPAVRIKKLVASPV